MCRLKKLFLLRRQWDKELTKQTDDKTPNLLRAIVKTFGREYFWYGFLNVFIVSFDW